MKLKKILNNEEDTSNLSIELIEYLKGKVVFLNGSLGAGKTTFVKHFAKNLGFDDQISSPTFSIVNNYLCKDLKITHFDLYRINSEDELEMTGFFDILKDKDTTFFIEWAEKFNLKNYIKNFVEININILDNNSREFILNEGSI